MDVIVAKIRVTVSIKLKLVDHFKLPLNPVNIYS